MFVKKSIYFIFEGRQPPKRNLVLEITKRKLVNGKRNPDEPSGHLYHYSHGLASFSDSVFTHFKGVLYSMTGPYLLGETVAV